MSKNIHDAKDGAINERIFIFARRKVAFELVEKDLLLRRKSNRRDNSRARIRNEEEDKIKTVDYQITGRGAGEVSNYPPLRGRIDNREANSVFVEEIRSRGTVSERILHVVGGLRNIGYLANDVRLDEPDPRPIDLRASSRRQLAVDHVPYLYRTRDNV